MMRWYLMEAGAAAAVALAVLSAYIQVRVRMRRAENRPGNRSRT
jgi:hypothetical protein